MRLRLKLPLVLMALVIAALAVSVVVTYTSLRSFLIQRVDQQLASGTGFVLDQINHQDGDGHPFGPGGGGSAPLPGGTFGQVVDSSGKVVAGPVVLYGVTGYPAPALPSKLPATSSGHPKLFTTGSVDGSSLRYRVGLETVLNRGTGAQQTLIVAVPLREVDQTLGRLRLIEIAVAGGVILLLGLLSWWLVRRELRPLEAMGTTAGAIAAGDLSRRVPQEDPKTEVGQLGVALNAMLTQIEQAFDERKASEERLRRFLADASHELRTPLTSIRGYAELFRRGAGERKEDLAKSMRRIEDESSRMGVIVEDLLLLARLDRDRGLLLEPVDLSQVAADAAADAHASDPDRSVALDAPQPVVVMADEARLRQVTANLMANALRYTPPATPVTLRVRAADGEASLVVEDHGPGLTEQQAAKVFEPFFRLDTSRDRATGGAGLGLSIVAAIAQAHDGRVEVVETPGGGATFVVRLPIAAGDKAAASPPDEAEPAERDAAGDRAAATEAAASSQTVVASSPTD
jgi:two-component system OmpR family sensor kinase